MNESSSNNQPFPPPPPPSNDRNNTKNPPVTNRRQLYMNSRMRTASSGSTRGAFGLMPVDASAHDPEDIFQRQQKAQQHRHIHINAVVDPLAGGGNGTSGNKGVNVSSSSSPGETINRNTGKNVAQIARDAMMKNDEEWGASQPPSGRSQNRSHRSNYGGTHNSNNQAYPGPPRSSQQMNATYRQQLNEMNMKNGYTWEQLPQPPSQYSNNQSNRYKSNESSLNYSYPTIGGESDMYYLQAGKLNAYGGVNVPPVDTKHLDPGPPGPARGDNQDKSLDSGSSYYSGSEYEEESPLSWYQYLVWNEQEPEFTSVQQSVWAVLIGIMMGFFTAMWGELIEWCVEFTWKTVPEYLLEKGIFTDLDGPRPLPYYMIVCPAVFGGILSYFTAVMTNPKVPGQNEWIESLHRVGIMDHTMFIPVIIFSTLGMASGLSLGPEMPLVLTAGMVGSVVAVRCKQSVLSARVMNLTAASAGIGGFFGLPMAGALFVLELPHRMGLQYFEALSPATLASIVSVIVNRMITGDDVKGMFEYPFLSESLPSNIFWVVIIYGIVGSFVGVIYAEGLLWLKHWVHDWFHAPHDDHHDDHDLKLEPHHNVGESMPLVVGSGNGMTHMHSKPKESCCTWMQKGVQRFFGIEHEPTRAAVAGVLAGIIVGFNCMLLPHLLFWGEAQLQTMIDRGMTPLPVFGYDDEPTAILTAYGYCLVDPEDERAQVKGFSAACSGIISLTKIWVVGLSLGTGVCGGHFWAPLFVGCAASHFFTDLMAGLSEYVGFGEQLSSYPCLAVLCIMGSTHVVTFRAQMAIILVLTLSIGSFSTQEKLRSGVNGDYSAIFPLLVVACFIPLLLTRNCTFYAKQVCRGDITAIPEVLCEPNKAGTTQIYRIDNLDDVTNSSGSADYGPEDEYRREDEDLSIDESDDESDDISLAPEKEDFGKTSIATPRTSEDTTFNFPPKPSSEDAKAGGTDMLSSSMHSNRSSSSRMSRRSNSSLSRPSLARVRSKGKIDDSNYQKPLLYQSREGASTSMKNRPRSNTPVNNVPKLPRSHKRTKSGLSASSDITSPKGDLDQSRH